MCFGSSPFLFGGISLPKGRTVVTAVPGQSFSQKMNILTASEKVSIPRAFQEFRSISSLFVGVIEVVSPCGRCWFPAQKNKTDGCPALRGSRSTISFLSAYLDAGVCGSLVCAYNVPVAKNRNPACVSTLVVTEREDCSFDAPCRKGNSLCALLLLLSSH